MSDLMGRFVFGLIFKYFSHDLTDLVKSAILAHRDGVLPSQVWEKEALQKKEKK